MKDIELLEAALVEIKESNRLKEEKKVRKEAEVKRVRVDFEA